MVFAHVLRVALVVKTVALIDCDCYSGQPLREPCGIRKDGGHLIPIPADDCPLNAGTLPACNTRLSHLQLCQGDGEEVGAYPSNGCRTNRNLNNCPFEYDVYRLETTTTTTSTTTAPWTGLWDISGDCFFTLKNSEAPNCVGNGNSWESRRRRAKRSNERCRVFLLAEGVPIFVRNFGTNWGHDFLTINGKNYSDHSIQGRSFLPQGAILWEQNATGEAGRWDARADWMLCHGPVCQDRLLLSPLKESECTADMRNLPNCTHALPGELCESDGECGTSSSLDNCPGELDVYRKSSSPTLTATTTTTSQTMTTTRTSTLFLSAPQGVLSWTISRRRRGGCATDSHGCVRLSGYSDDDCHLTAPRGALVMVHHDFSARRRVRDFYVNGKWTRTWSSFFRVGQPLPRSDAAIEKLCLSSSCGDGALLRPLEKAECPSFQTISALPSCEKVAPGEMCEAAGECGTRANLDNCGESDVYLKVTLSTATSTTRTVTQTVKKDGTWSMSECSEASSTDDASCIQVKGGRRRDWYEHRRRRSSARRRGETKACNLRVVGGADVTFTMAGGKWSSHDHGWLVINGQPFSSGERAFPDGKSFSMSNGLIEWDGMIGTWELCLAPLSCSSGVLIPLHPSECPRPTELMGLRPCNSASVGDLCEGDGECGTDVNLDNCLEMDVYRKLATTATTTLATTTVTSRTSASRSSEMPTPTQAPTVGILCAGAAALGLAVCALVVLYFWTSKGQPEEEPSAV